MFPVQIIVLVLPILVSLPILWEALMSLLVTLTLMSVRISVTDSSNWLTSMLSGMPLITILFLLPYCFILLVEYSNSSSFCSNHSHEKWKDSLETRAACSWILILTWNFGGGLGDSASTFSKWQVQIDFDAVRTIIDCFIC